MRAFFLTPKLVSKEGGGRQEVGELAETPELVSSGQAGERATKNWFQKTLSEYSERLTMYNVPQCSKISTLRVQYKALI